MKIAIIGEIIIDVVLGNNNDDHKMRLGGIIHAALAAWTAGIEYEVYYISPNYIDDDIKNYLNMHGCSNFSKIGEIRRSPGVILIGEAKETGNQKYSLLMSDSMESHVYTIPPIEDSTDIIVFPGNYDLLRILEGLKNIEDKRLHIDIANGVESINNLNNMYENGIKFDTIFNSTSHHITDAPDNLINLFLNEDMQDLTQNYILKENRGGGRLIANNSVFTYPAFPRYIEHSVGVGDAFDIYYISMISTEKNLRLRRSSLLASEYATTNFPDDLRSSITKLLQNISAYDHLEGITLHYESRASINIYVAGPDFDWIDTRHIREVENSLKYHNFNPLLPIKLNGQIDDFTDHAAISRTFSSDIDLIKSSHILLAVILNDDHGTLIEIGYAVGIGIPVIVYDPYRIARNPMLTELPVKVSDNLDEIIMEVFKIASSNIR